MANEKKPESITIGAYWNNQGKYGPYQSVVINDSVVVNGQRQESDFELILRQKSTQVEMNLTTGEGKLVLQPLQTKKKETSPDGLLVVKYQAE